MPGPKGIGEPPTDPPCRGVSSRVRFSILYVRKDEMFIKLKRCSANP